MWLLVTLGLGLLSSVTIFGGSVFFSFLSSQEVATGWKSFLTFLNIVIALINASDYRT